MKKNIFNLYRKIQNKFRVVNLNNYNYEINLLNEKINELEKKISYDDIFMCKKNINEMKSHNYIVESELYAIIQRYEYKLYEFNKSTNELLYKNKLEINRLNGFERKNFRPKVSIIIPIYNGERYIKYAIESALNQTYKNIEIIVVDDGSTDGSAKIVKSYGNKIRYYRKDNGGVSSALNLGIQKMTGDYFTWLSHDDLYYESNIEKHIEYLTVAEDENIITYTNFNIIDENGNLKLQDTIWCNLFCFDYKINQIKNEYSLLQGEINGGSVMIPKKAFEECGLFDEHLRIAQERDMWFRMMGKYRFFNIPLETTAIRTHSNQVTNINKDVEKETNKKRLEIIKKMSPEKLRKLEHTEKNFYTVMKNYYSINRIKELEEEMDKLIELKEGKIS